MGKYQIKGAGTFFLDAGQQLPGILGRWQRTEQIRNLGGLLYQRPE
jgi:hypothetical protein